MKTVAQARALALADGIPEEDLTPEVLKQYGWEPEDPSAGMVYDAVQTPKQVKDDLALLAAEAKENAWPSMLVKALQRVGAVALKFVTPVVLVVAMLFLSGCKSTQAVHSVDQAAIAVATLHAQHCDFENRFIEANRARQEVQVEADAEAAMRSITRTITVTERIPKTMVDGKVTEWMEVQREQQVANPVTVQALVRKRLANLRALDEMVRAEKAQQTQIGVNATNALSYLAGLKEYFTGLAAQQAALTDAENAAWAVLDAWLAKLGPKVAVPIAP
jgi:outer membrane murein-binding lipoprotein Lpp